MHIFSWVLFVLLELFFAGIFGHLWVENCSLLLMTCLFVLLSFKFFLLLVLTLLLLFIVFAWLVLRFFLLLVLCAEAGGGNLLLQFGSVSSFNELYEFINVDWRGEFVWCSWLEILVVPSGIR